MFFKLTIVSLIFEDILKIFFNFCGIQLLRNYMVFKDL